MAWLDASVGRLSIHVFSVFENTKYLYFYNAYVLNLSLVWVWTEMWNTPHFQRAQWPLEYIWRQIRNTKIHYRCKTPLSPPVQWEPPWIAVLLWGPPSKKIGEVPSHHGFHFGLKMPFWWHYLSFFRHRCLVGMGDGNDPFLSSISFSRLSLLVPTFQKKGLATSPSSK